MFSQSFNLFTVIFHVGEGGGEESLSLREIGVSVLVGRMSVERGCLCPGELSPPSLAPPQRAARILLQGILFILIYLTKAEVPLRFIKCLQCRGFTNILIPTAHVWLFIRSIQTVLVSITLPAGRDAHRVVTPEFLPRAVTV